MSLKPGARVLGIAESYRETESTVAGAVVRVDRTVDGFAFETCTVGGTDATGAIRSVVERLGREDIQVLMIAGIAPAWFNVVDLQELREATGLPALSVSFEESPGLAAAIADAFEGEERARRLETYRAQPPRRRVETEPPVFVRAVGCEAERAATVVRHTTETGRPEPVRVARLAARAADRFRR